MMKEIGNGIIFNNESVSLKITKNNYVDLKKGMFVLFKSLNTPDDRVLMINKYDVISFFNGMIVENDLELDYLCKSKGFKMQLTKENKIIAFNDDEHWEIKLSEEEINKLKKKILG